MKDMNQIKEALSHIAYSYGLKRVYVFGSYAKGTATADSDIDLLIEKGRPLSLLMLSGLRQDVQESLGMPVDIVTTSGIDQSFKEAISGTEILIYEG